MKIIYVGAIILFIGGIATLLVLLLRKKHNNKDQGPCANAPPGPEGSPCHWSDQQKKDVLNRLMSTQPITPQSTLINTCILNQLSTYYPYSDQVGNVIDPKVSSVCLGVKGAWTSNFKEYFSSILNLTNMQSGCISCIIPVLEKNFDPLDFQNISSTSLDAQISKLVIDNCPNVCTTT